MQFVKTSDLKPGMRLAKPIYNKMGVMLYERDTRLNAQGIESIKNFNLIGIYILEPAEPAIPLSKEDIAFEQFQTVSMFQLRSCMEQIRNDELPAGLHELVESIIANYGSLNHKLNFTQNLRSSGDFVYKHSISTAILAAMISHAHSVPDELQFSCVTAALLYDIGYLYVSQDILDNGKNTNASDLRIIDECRRIGYEKLAANAHTDLNDTVLKIISQTIQATRSDNRNANLSLSMGAKILKIADTFDRMTAMDIDAPPVSEMVAIRYLYERPERYDTTLVQALSKSINILPTGCCVDLSTHEKALVLMENPDDFTQPLILKFSDNQIYDLRDPETAKQFQVKDIMKTMDNRIVIDEATLKHFYADDVIKAATDNFRKTKTELIEKGRYTPADMETVKPVKQPVKETVPLVGEEEEKAAPAPASTAAFSNAAEEPQKKPVRRLK